MLNNIAKKIDWKLISPFGFNFELSTIVAEIYNSFLPESNMKPIQGSVLAAGIAAVLAIGLVGCDAGTQTASKATSSSAAASTQSVTFFVEGMI